MEDDPHVLAIARLLVSDMGPTKAATLARQRAEHFATLKSHDAYFWRRVLKVIEQEHDGS